MDRILILDDDEHFLRMLEYHFKKKFLGFKSFSSPSKALNSIRITSYSAGIIDMKLPNTTGIDVMKTFHKEFPDAPVIIMTAYGDIETAVKAIKSGAWDYIQKPFDPDVLILRLRRALRERVLELTKTSEKYPIIGNSLGIKEIISLAKRVANADTTVLLLSESGTGKELFARNIHEWSDRKEGPFVVINSAAIPETLLESELFGIEKGTATGVEKKVGKIELADGGTVFFDEIGDMPLPIQAKILRVIEEKNFERVGGRRTINVEIRIIAATNKNLERMIEEKKFREDLYYRLNVFPIEILPLRERLEDIPVLVKHFIQKYNPIVKTHIKGISPSALKKLKRYPWPGNVRELENIIERAMILEDSEYITPENIILSQKEEWKEGTLKDAVAYVLKNTEIKLIKSALKKTGGNKWNAAKILGISYKSLYNKMKKYRMVGK